MEAVNKTSPRTVIEMNLKLRACYTVQPQRVSYSDWIVVNGLQWVRPVARWIQKVEMAHSVEDWPPFAAWVRFRPA